MLKTLWVALFIGVSLAVVGWPWWLVLPTIVTVWVGVAAKWQPMVERKTWWL